MNNEKKAHEIVNKQWKWIADFIEKNNLSKEDRNQIRFQMYCACLDMAVWKDEQYRMDKTHLDMVYEALDGLYQVRYGDNPILNTGSQTDVFLYMIEDFKQDMKD